MYIAVMLTGWDFVVQTNKDLHVEYIPRDQDWWKQQLPKIQEFYFSTFLPELAFPWQEKAELGSKQQPPKCRLCCNHATVHLMPIVYTLTHLSHNLNCHRSM